MKFIKDYDFMLQYFSGTTNEVTNALNKKLRGSIASGMIQEQLKLETASEFDQGSNMRFCWIMYRQPTLLSKIIQSQVRDEFFTYKIGIIDN